MIKFSKVRDVEAPIRAHDTDAGIDFFIPLDLTEEVMFAAHNKIDHFKISDSGNILIRPHCRVNIPSGIHVALHDDHALVAFNKSGIAAKRGLLVGACVVDSGYQGEIHINLINTNDVAVLVEAGTKILQFLYVPVRLDHMLEVPLHALYDEETERGDGGFGSSDEKCLICGEHLDPEDAVGHAGGYRCATCEPETLN